MLVRDDSGPIVSVQKGLSMQLSRFKGDPFTAVTDLLVVAVDRKTFKQQLKEFDVAFGGALLKSAKEQDFSGKSKQKLVLHTLGKLRCGRICLAGMGDSNKTNAEIFLHLGATAVRVGNSVGAKTVTLWLPALEDEQLRVLARGAVLGGYRYDVYRGDKGRAATVKKLQIGAATGKFADAAIKVGETVGRAVCSARDLVNESPLQLYPETFAKKAKAMAKACKLTVKVFGPTELKRMKMHLLLGVGQGSSRLPRLVHLTYMPSAAKDKQKAPTVLVGKGITFDSGGLSLKPPASMVDMKIDMGGAAAVFGAMQALAGLKPKHPVHGLLVLAENMPSATAIRPGDVITGAAGTSVEINNTDAEGRLVLADALHYATKLNPARIIDLATLTGACMVALGPHTVGAFSNNDSLATDALRAAKSVGEDFWRMPLTSCLREQLNSDVADMKNTGERWGGAITAGLFLKEFVADKPWLHLDIAGPASSSKSSGAISKGGTGVGVATLIELITSQS